MTLDAKALEPCPFCGGEAKSTYIRDGRQIACLPCGARGPSEFHGPSTMLSAEDRAINGWNRRIRLPHAGKVSEELRQAAYAVCWFDWSSNDADAVAAIDHLRSALSSQQAEAAPVGYVSPIHFADMASNFISLRRVRDSKFSLPLYTSPSPADAGEPGIKALEYLTSAANAIALEFVSKLHDRHHIWAALKEARAVLRSASIPATSHVSGGVAAIAAERRRQIEAEGWTPAHDDKHTDGELARAAACYAVSRHGRSWPWSAAWWKPTDRRRDLVKAGALIAAEIDRLDRQALRSSSPVGQETAKEGE